LAEKPVYIRYATRMEKLVLKLDRARDEERIAQRLTCLTILDKGTGNFTLIIICYDGTRVELDQDEVLNGDVYQFDMWHLLLTNTAQAGKTIKLLVDQQVAPPAEE